VSEQTKSILSTHLPLYLGLTLAVGIFIGSKFSGNKLDSNDRVLQSTLKLREILFHVDREYVDTVNMEQLVENAIGGLLKDLDPHSAYLTPRRSELANQSLQGAFDGIGVEFTMVRDTLTVMGVITDGPSSKAGVLPGDKILIVDKDTIAGRRLDSQEIISKLRGPRGSSVYVAIKRRNEPELIGYTLIRDKIPTKSVDVAYMSTPEIGYIKVNSFGATTADEFKLALNNLKRQGMTKLMIDLRGNGGGYVSAAELMADELLGQNALIVSQKGKQEMYNKDTRAIRPGAFEDGPIVVLMDEFSASAAEILAGALQDNDRALIVGRRSFGKGLVQRPIKLNDGSELRLTIARYYTPSGRSIQRPYDNGRNEYQSEIKSRFESRELFGEPAYSDTSFVYTTTKGRTVFGGGGIMPDYYVSLDTMENSPYLNQLLSSQVLRELAIEYTEEHQIKLRSWDPDSFKKDFVIDDEMIQSLISRAEKQGVPFRPNQFKASEQQIRRYLKAFIGRSLWGEEGFYPVLNLGDAVYLRALSLFDEAETLARN
jgi:carboxyl-terminal processing protease